MEIPEDNIKKSDRINNDSQIKIIGFGNQYMSDDAVGIKVVNLLKEHEISNRGNLEIIDGGTSGVDLIFLLKNTRKAIIIDAVDAGQPGGQVIVFSPDQVKEFKKCKNAFKSFSLHDIDLVEVFELIKTLDLKTKIRIIGIKPEKIGFGENLSPVVEGKIPEIISLVLKEVEEI
jgi:hydrogenase maturation protease